MVEMRKPTRGRARSERDPRFTALALVVEYLYSWCVAQHTEELTSAEREELITALELVRSMVDA